MEWRLIWHRKSQRRKWNPFGGAPSLFPSPMFYAITAAASLTSFPWYLRNFRHGTTLALHPQPQSLNFLALREAGYPWGPGFLCLPVSSRGWHYSRVFMIKVGRWGESSFLFPSTPFRSFFLPFSGNTPLLFNIVIFICHICPSLPHLHFSTWHTVFIPTCKHSHPSVSVPWSAYFLRFKR